MIEAESAPADPGETAPAPAAAARDFDLGPQQVDAAATAGDLAFAVLRQQFQRVLEHEAGTRLGQEPEQLHAMRVALRRMRAALRTFRDVLPARVLRLARELAWLSGALGKVRDLDVQIARLDPWNSALEAVDRPALDALSRLLLRRHATARRRMLVAFDARRYERLVQRVSRELRRGPGRTPKAARQTAAIHAPEAIVRRYKSVIKHARRIDAQSPPQQYHRLRIRCKALRYALEFHAPLWGPPARRLIKATVKLQDLLGEYQDAEVAAADLRRLAAGSGLPRSTVFVIGRLAEHCTVAAAALRARLDGTLAGLRGSRWRRLRREMERRTRLAVRGLPAQRRAPGPAAR